MGSYLRNCFISNQIIPTDSQVVVIPIVQQQGYKTVKLVGRKDPLQTFEGRQACSSSCYPNAYWKPLGIYIEGKGDDSYRVEPFDTPFNRISLMTFFKEVYSKAFDVSEESEDGALKINDFFEEKSSKIKAFITTPRDTSPSQTLGEIAWENFENLWEAIHEQINEQQIFIEDYQGRPSVLQFTTCLKASYNYLVAYSDDPRTFMDYSFEHEMKSLRENSEFSVKNSKYREFSVSRIFKLEGGGQANHGYYAYEEAIVQEYDWKDEANYSEENFRGIKSRFKLIEDFMSFQFNLSVLNLQFHPVHGASQDYSNETGTDYSKMVAHISKINREYLKADGHFEDEDDE